MHACECMDKHTFVIAPSAPPPPPQPQTTPQTPHAHTTSHGDRDRERQRKKTGKQKNPPDELARTIFSYESSESYRVFNYLQDSNSMFRAAGIISEKIFGRTVFTPKKRWHLAEQEDPLDYLEEDVTGETPLKEEPRSPKSQTSKHKEAKC